MPLRPAFPVLATLALLLGACAQSSDAAHSGPVVSRAGTATDPPDPYEATNRQIHDFNFRLDDCCIKPVALGYRRLFHPWVRTRIRSAVDNIQEPRAAVNALLQGRPREATETTLRFVINSTLGLGGLFDMAQFGGPPQRPRDFGETLHVWGVQGGPYLVLPIGGPSNARDLAGFVGDAVTNPLGYVIPFWGNATRSAVGGVDLREQNIENVEALRAESLDFYARLRSVWYQRRNAQLGIVSADDPGGLDVLDDPAAARPDAAPRASAPPAAPSSASSPGVGGAEASRAARAPSAAVTARRVRPRLAATAALTARPAQRQGKVPGAARSIAGSPAAPVLTSPRPSPVRLDLRLADLR
jgi:phospholipid-binding lipoprotein MlaA